MRRRDVLAFGASAFLTGVAGCNQGASGSGPSAESTTAADAATTGDAVSETTSAGPDGNAEGWTSFRGDASRDGVRDAAAGPGDDPSVAWELTFDDVLRELTGTSPDDLTIPLSIRSLNGPVVVGGNAVFSLHVNWMSEDDDGTSQRQWLLAVDTADGTLNWTATLFSSADGSGYPVPLWPEADGETVYVPVFVDETFAIQAFGAKNGDRQARIEIDSNGVGGQPVVTDGTLYVRTAEESGGALTSVDLDAGTENWSVDAPAPRQNPVEVTVSGDAVWYFERGTPGEVVVRNREDGAERVRTPVEMPTSLMTDQPGQLVAAPVVDDETAYAAGTLKALVTRDQSALAAVDPGENGGGWTYKPPEVPTEFYRTLLGEEATDEQLESLAESIDYSSAYGLPAVTDDLVLATGYGGFPNADPSNPSHLLAVDRAEGSLRWAVGLDGVSFAPVVAGETAYVATATGVEVVSLDGEHVATVSLERYGGGPSSTPALADGRLYLATFEKFVALE